MFRKKLGFCKCIPYRHFNCSDPNKVLNSEAEAAESIAEVDDDGNIQTICHSRPLRFALLQPKVAHSGRFCRAMYKAIPNVPDCSFPSGPFTKTHAGGRLLSI